MLRLLLGALFLALQVEEVLGGEAALSLLLLLDLIGDSKVCVHSGIDGKSTQFIALHADRPAFVDLIFPLHDLLIRLANVSGIGKKKILCDPLLQGNPCRRIHIVSPDQGIDLQAGDAA
jgi:hypothetical protein